MEPTRDTIANHLRIVRDLAGISPEEASARAARADDKLSASYIRRLERGKNSPTIDTLIVLCRAYGIDLLKFFTSMTQTNGKRKTA